MSSIVCTDCKKTEACRVCQICAGAFCAACGGDLITRETVSPILDIMDSIWVCRVDLMKMNFKTWCADNGIHLPQRSGAKK